MTWEKEFGKKRRAIDKALLQECEKNIDRIRIAADIQAEIRAKLSRATGHSVETLWPLDGETK